MKGFPAGTRYTPVPNPLFGPLLEAIEDLAELKCTLRVLWLLHQRKGYPRFVTARELLADRVLSTGLGHLGNPQEAIKEGLRKAVERGTLLVLPITAEGKQEELYLLNTDADGRALEAIKGGELTIKGLAQAPTAPEPGPARPNIFVLYEENIGMLTPLLAEELKEAEETYPWPWIQEAFREGVSRNRRSWRYIQRILERWATEGKGGYGEPGRHPEKIGLKEYLRRHGRPDRP